MLKDQRLHSLRRKTMLSAQSPPPNQARLSRSCRVGSGEGFCVAVRVVSFLRRRIGTINRRLLPELKPFKLCEGLTCCGQLARRLVQRLHESLNLPTQRIEGGLGDERLDLVVPISLKGRDVVRVNRHPDGRTFNG